MYDDGQGSYPAPGQYVQYRSKLYLEADTKRFDMQTMKVLYGLGKNPEPLEYLLSLARLKFKAKATLGPSMVAKMPIFATAAKNNSRIII